MAVTLQVQDFHFSELWENKFLMFNFSGLWQSITLL